MHQLVQWHQEFCTPAVLPGSREAPGAFRDLQRQHELLQRELRRKQKALAEVAALLVLQKKLPGVAGGRGHMRSVQQRQNLLKLIDQACADGARRYVACRQVGLSWRSMQRWQRSDAPEGDSSACRASGVMCVQSPG